MLRDGFAGDDPRRIVRCGDVGVEELDADDEEPDPKGEAEGALWDVFAGEATEKNAAEAAENEVTEEVSVGGVLGPVSAAACEGEDEAEEDVCANDLRGGEGAERQESGGAQGTCTGGGEADLCADGKHEEREEVAAVGCVSTFADGAGRRRQSARWR